MGLESGCYSDFLKTTALTTHYTTIKRTMLTRHAG